MRWKDARRNANMCFKHLKENNMSYKQHWMRAMCMSIALFVHAWVPSLFPTYASDKMKESHAD